MGIEEEIANIEAKLNSINISLLALNQKLDKLLEKNTNLQIEQINSKLNELYIQVIEKKSEVNRPDMPVVKETLKIEDGKLIMDDHTEMG